MSEPQVSASNNVGEELAKRLSQLSEKIDERQSSVVESFNELRDELTVLTANLEELHKAQEEQAAQLQRAAEEAEAAQEAAVQEEPPAEPPPQEIPVATAAPPIETATPVAVQAVPAQQPPQQVIVGDSKLEQIIFGENFSSIPFLAADRKELIAGLLGGDETAMALAGQLLIFRAADAETMPQLLKGLGEAYYDWRPQTARQADDPMRDAMIEDLHRACEAVGVNHKITLARPGDRFENKRHNTKQRGVEVADVHGWIVLRENGSVYTKANVTVQ